MFRQIVYFTGNDLIFDAKNCPSSEQMYTYSLSFEKSNILTK